MHLGALGSHAIKMHLGAPHSAYAPRCTRFVAILAQGIFLIRVNPIIFAREHPALEL